MLPTNEEFNAKNTGMSTPSEVRLGPVATMLAPAAAGAVERTAPTFPPTAVAGVFDAAAPAVPEPDEDIEATPAFADAVELALPFSGAVAEPAVSGEPLLPPPVVELIVRAPTAVLALGIVPAAPAPPATTVFAPAVLDAVAPTPLGAPGALMVPVALVPPVAAATP